jgi:hypothetical protein
MNIREVLQDRHYSIEITRVVKYVGGDPERFHELIMVVFGKEYRPAQRAAWALNYCAERHPELIKPYLTRLIGLLERDDCSDPIRRSVARLLQFQDIPARLRGRVYAACYDLVDDPHRPVAVRVFALTVAANLAKDEPDLMGELRLMCSKYLPGASAGFRARARKVLA